jgi:tetratricopeptide (TPR) repeat protein
VTAARRPARAALLPFCVLGLAACQASSRDRFVAGENAMRRGDLFQALQSFDDVPVTDPRYPEARLTAAALERRVRRQMELLLLGLRMRSEWRDEEAMSAFRDALQAWPGNPGAQALLAATEARQRTLAPLRSAGMLAAPAAPVRVLADPASAPPPRPLAEGALPAADVAQGPQPAASDPRPPLPAVAPQLDDPTSPEAAAELSRIEARLAGGIDLEPLLAELVALQRTYPNDARVANRLARLLQQRGLMRYGLGNVAGALTDWQRAIDLDPELRTARTLLELATAELAEPSR